MSCQRDPATARSLTRLLRAGVSGAGYAVLIAGLALPLPFSRASATGYAATVAPDASTETGSPVGRLPGRHQVTERGEAEYGIPFEFPSGVNGLQPEMELVCNSHGANGPLGIGCRLSGPSLLHRCPRSYRVDGRVEPVRYSADDPLCRDGRRLLLAGGEHGGDGSRYRELINGFDEIVRHGASDATATFSVRLASGLTLTYGGPGATIGGTPQGTLAERPRSRVTYAWLLRTVSDPFGNEIVYEYRDVRERVCPRGCPQGAVEVVLDRILYGGSTGGTGHTRSIVFEYSTEREDALLRYVSGLGIRTSVLLRRVLTMVGGAPVRSYELTYDFSGASRSRLRAVTMCNGEGDCLEPTRFTWTEQSHGIAGRSRIFTGKPRDLPWWTIYDFGVGGRVDVIPGSFVAADTDADGPEELYFMREATSSAPRKWYRWRLDGQPWSGSGPVGVLTPVALPADEYVVSPSEADPGVVRHDRGDEGDWLVERSEAFYWQVHAADRDGVVKPLSRIEGCTGRFFYHYLRTDTWHAGDMDGDGVADFSYVCGEYADAWFWRRLRLDGTWDAALSLLQADLPILRRNSTSPVDLDGDRDDEVTVVAQDPKVGRVRIQGGAMTPLGVGDGFFMDVNGDGLRDLIFFSEQGVGVALNTGDGFAPSYDALMPEDGPATIYEYAVYRDVRVADFNRDGRPDFLLTATQFGWPHAILHLSDGRVFHRQQLDDLSCTELSDQHFEDAYFGCYINPDFATPATNREYVGPRGDWLGAFRVAKTMNHVQVTDVDGDVWPELTHWATDDDGLWVTRFGGTVGDRLELVDDGQRMPRFSYADISTPGLYEPGRLTTQQRALGLKRLRKGLEVVARVEEVGTGIERTFTYREAVSDPAGQHLLGFEEINESRTNETEVTVTRTFELSPLAAPFEYRRVTKRRQGPGTERVLVRDVIMSMQSPMQAPVAGGSVRLLAQSLLRLGEQACDACPMDVWDEVTTYAPHEQSGLPSRVEATVKSTGETHVDQYSWDSERRLLLGVLRKSTVGGAGEEFTSTFFYDALGALRSVAVGSMRAIGGPGGGWRLVTGIGRDARGRILTMSMTDYSTAERPTRHLRFAYDDDGVHVASVTNPLGHTTRFDRDPSRGLLRSVTDPNGVVDAFTWDGFGHLLEARRGSGPTRRFSYAGLAGGWVDVTMESSDGPIQRARIDHLGRLRELATQEFDAVQVAGDRWTTSSFDYDREDNLIQTLTTDGKKTLVEGWTYDGYGWPTATHGLSTKTFTYERMVGGPATLRVTVTDQRLGTHGVKEVDALGRTLAEYTADPYGVPLAETRISYVLGPFVRLREMRTVDASWAFQYGSLGELVSLRAPDRAPQTRIGNGFGELVEVITGEEHMRITRDLGGRPTTIDDGRAVTTISYDQAEHGVGKPWRADRQPDGVTVETGYAEDGNVARVTQRVAGWEGTLHIGWEGGRHTGVTYPDGSAVDYGYVAGFLSEITAETGEELWRLLSTTFHGVADRERVVGGNVWRRYSPTTGALQKEKITIDAPRASSRERIVTSRDTSGRVRARRHRFQGAVRSERFRFDENRCLARWAGSAQTRGGSLRRWLERYEFSADGRLSSKDRLDADYAAARDGFPHALTSLGSNTYEYDGDGRRTQSSGSNAWVARYTPTGGLSDLRSPGGELLGQFGYAPTGERAWRRTPDELRVFMGALFELDVDDAASVAHVHVGQREVARIVTDSNGGRRNLGAVADVMGTTQALTQDGAGTLRRYFFGPWGTSTSLDGTRRLAHQDAEGAPRFAGHPLDIEGLIYARRRYYDSETLALLTPDPVVSAAHGRKGLHPFLYALGDPTSYVDPSGLQVENPGNWVGGSPAGNGGGIPADLANLLTSITPSVGAATAVGTLARPIERIWVPDSARSADPGAAVTRVLKQSVRVMDEVRESAAYSGILFGADLYSSIPDAVADLSVAKRRALLGAVLRLEVGGLPISRLPSPVTLGKVVGVVGVFDVAYDYADLIRAHQRGDWLGFTEKLVDVQFGVTSLFLGGLPGVVLTVSYDGTDFLLNDLLGADDAISRAFGAPEPGGARYSAPRGLPRDSGGCGTSACIRPLE